MQPLFRSAHAVHSLHYHLVLVTKYRKPALNADLLQRLEAISAETLRRWCGALVEFNGEADHAHLLIQLPPDAAPSRVIGSLKSRSSRLLRRDYPTHLSRFYWKPILWSPSYCLVSCGGAPLSVIRQYIEQQNRPL